MSGHADLATGRGEIASLNGIRALAVSLVFLSHGGQGELVPGGLGVTVFFVLSGYLITTLLRREHQRHGALDLRGFYLRRLLRLMPPLVVVVVLSGALAAGGLIEGGFSFWGLLSVLFYFGNYHVIATDFGGIPAGLGVIWSLAVEEHYYLLYPPLVLLLLRRGDPRKSALVLAALCVLILAWRLFLALQGVSERHLTMASDTRADAILMGCVMAFLPNPAFGVSPQRRPWRDLAIAVSCLAVLAATLLYRGELFRHTARYTVQCVTLAPLIFLAVQYAASPVFRWLNSRPLVYLGTVSYTVYLVHQVVIYGLMFHLPQWGSVPIFVLAALLTLAIAEPMRRWVDLPFGQLRRRLRPSASAEAQPRTRSSAPLPTP